MAFTIDGLPPSIRVGPYEIAIVALPKDENSYGEFSSVEQEIRLQREFATGALAVDTLLHELLHAAWFASALPKRCGEERAVSGLAPNLAHILMDNPEVLKWMQRARTK